MKYFRDIIILVLLALAISLIARTTIETREVFHQSMLPTIEPGEYLIVSKAAYFFKDPQRGDIIVLKHPYDPNEPLIKRVIGLPGDFIEIRDHKVFINGSPLNEPYIREPVNYKYPYQEIPEDNYFVLGDNRNISNDSHKGWTVPRENIIGKAWITYWPPSKWKIIKDYNPLISILPVIIKMPFPV